LALYRKGIAELEQGVALELSSGADERAERIRDKMLVNMDMARERAQHLGTYTLFSQLHND